MTLKFDSKNAESFYNENELSEIQPMVSTADKLLRTKTGAGSDFLGWVNLPTDYDKQEFSRIKGAAKKIQDDSEILIVIGIGGSYLGARAVIEFLNKSFNNEQSTTKTKVYFAGNSISPAYLNDLIELIGDKDFSVNVISKSGTTTEPAIAFRVFRNLLEERYGKDGAKSRIYSTTDADKGALHDETISEGWERFVVPNSVGGRFSVLTAVGLLPIAVSGIDIDELMSGAKSAQEKYVETDLTKNDAYKYAAIRNIMYGKGYSTEILANWEPSMQYISEWWKQLFGESEGKNKKGIYPSSANYSTDLHSLGQYIQDGRRNLFETVLKLDNPVSNLNVPKTENDGDGLNYLTDLTMDEINTKAFQGVVLAHVDGGVPNLAIHLEKQDAFNLGELIYFFEIAVAISGYLFAINPFNQEGVEDYKRNMFALLGKPGYEERGEELKKRL